MVKNIRILAIDNELPSLKTALIQEGYEVITAVNNAEVFKIFGRKNPNLILLNLNTPEPDGWTTLQMLRANPATRDVKVIILSAEDNLANVEKAFAAGASGFLSTRANLERFIKKIAFILLPDTLSGPSSGLSTAPNPA